VLLPAAARAAADQGRIEAGAPESALAEGRVA
jgi:hypothetical protein